MRVFEKTTTIYAIHIDDDDFLALMDSESYATGDAAFKDNNKTLCDKLYDQVSGIWDIEYNGHFGANVYLNIEADSDTLQTKKKIDKIITEHLKWCRSLELVDFVKEQRKKEK